MIQIPNSSWFTIKYEPSKKPKLIKPVEKVQKESNVKEKIKGVDYYA